MINVIWKKEEAPGESRICSQRVNPTENCDKVALFAVWSILTTPVSVLAVSSGHGIHTQRKNEKKKNWCRSRVGCVWFAVLLRLLEEACELTRDFGVEGLSVDEESIHVKDAVGDVVLRLSGHCDGSVEGSVRGNRANEKRRKGDDYGRRKNEREREERAKKKSWQALKRCFEP